MGVTGVEDLLQDNLKECIDDFRNAGIKIWMLTGDKGATAKEIAYSCALITKSTENPLKIDVDQSKVINEEENFVGLCSCLNYFNYA